MHNQSTKPTNLKAGDVVHGFEIREVAEYDELKAGGEGTAYGILARHLRSGAEVFHVLNGDEENLFAFAFATAVGNSTGVAHIVEHTVLCGSERYPMKDAFLVLCQGSLQTYLNAWTFPDKTVYPASSVNEADYFNVMAVYADAVFCPRLEEWTFMQEGHRLEYAENGKLVSNGVVFNEMKGAYSSLDEYMGRWSVKSVLPDTPYAFDSGGDPACIPDLTYQEFREFHKERYNPANCKVFLAGNIPTEKQLAFLDEHYFSRLPSGTAFPPVGRALPWSERRAFTVPVPGIIEDKAAVFLSWLCPVKDAVETLALQVLSDILMGHDGSPLSRVLIESGLGEDMASCSGIEIELREAVFSAGLHGVSQQNALSETDNAIAALIKSTLQRLVADGIAAEDTEGALLSLEFSLREVRRANGPYALVWLRRALRSWMRGGHPKESLLVMPRWNELKERIAADPRYFETLIEKVLLNNPHEALVVMKPEKTFMAKQARVATRKLNKREKAFTDEERQMIRDKAAEMEVKQNTPDSPSLLAKIPHLSVKDLSRSIDRVPREMYDAGGIPALAHPLFTNGISYLDFAFPLDVLEPEDYPWLPFFARAVTSIGIPGKDYGEMSSLLARTLGDIHTVLRSGGMVEGTTSGIETPSGVFDLAGRDWLIFHAKMLDEKIVPSLDLLAPLIKDANFNDTRRLRDLIFEMKTDADSSLAPAGHNYAASRTGMYLSRGRLVAELWHGIAQIQFIHWLLNVDIDEVKRKLIAIRESLLAKSGLLVNITGENIPAVLNAVRDRFASFGPVQRRGEKVVRAEQFYPFFDGASFDGALFSGAMLARHFGSPGKRTEVFASPSMQTGFAARSFPALPFGAEGHAAEQVLCHRLSTGALWEELRMKGGAYGAFAYTDPLEKVFSFSTYRDPTPAQSLAAFSRILEHEAGQVLDRDTLEKVIIGTYSKIKQPKTNAEKGIADLFRFFSNIDDEMRAKNLEHILDTDAGKLAAAAADAGKRFPDGAAAVIAGMEAARKTAKSLGVAVTPLPV
ncbi:MAG: insulinase family protein [Spirochaetaceae bacterium]|jgi:Zn-dependent M16 (insulinase) family peptidase|nr:insulinase family protein [Spirochaetaceae bacterium]